MHYPYCWLIQLLYHNGQKKMKRIIFNSVYIYPNKNLNKKLSKYLLIYIIWPVIYCKENYANFDWEFHYNQVFPVYD